jgi:hypothetical protein
MDCTVMGDALVNQAEKWVPHFFEIAVMRPPMSKHKAWTRTVVM